MLSKKKIDLFLKVLEFLANNDPDELTKVIQASSKSEQAKLEEFFSNVVDQTPFATDDYLRLRKFFIDLFASIRTLITATRQSGDPHALTNSDLDELFRSFGYPYSSKLRGFDENPLEQKVQFFLDLVNLYKVKGTPQSLVDVLQYYGVTDVDIYEFLLKLKSEDQLFFEGKVVAGTSFQTFPISIPFNNLTEGDPHWFYTEEEILQLNQTNKIKLPSQTPYLGIQPIMELDGVEFSLISRQVQDQFQTWVTTGQLPPADAEISFIGETKSFLELYLSTVYLFNTLFEVGKDSDRFFCYDGTNADDYQLVVDEFQTITGEPIRRCDLNDNENLNPPPPNSELIVSESYCADSKLVQFYDLFTRPSTSNFLVDRDTAGIILAQMNPTLKQQLDSLGEPLEVLFSLLKDLALWVRNTIGHGFLSFGFALFGIYEFFKELKDVISFFKPYHARLLLFELLQIKNRLFNSIELRDSFYSTIGFVYHDFHTADSIPCCHSDSTSQICVSIPRCRRTFFSSPQNTVWKGIWQEDIVYSVNDVVSADFLTSSHYVCLQNHTSSDSTKPGVGSNWTTYWQQLSYIDCSDEIDEPLFHSRDLYDCGSYHDIGVSTDLPRNLFVEITDEIHDNLVCPRASYFDSTDADVVVTSEILQEDSKHSAHLPFGTKSIFIELSESMTTTNYSLILTLRELSGNAEIVPLLIRQKTVDSFVVEVPSELEHDSYYLNWYTSETTNAGISNIPIDSTSMFVSTPVSCLDKVVLISIENSIDSSPIFVDAIVENVTTTGFYVRFSDTIPTSNYKLNWVVCEGYLTGSESLAAGTTELTISLPVEIPYSTYPLVCSLSCQSSSLTNSVCIIEQTATYFKVRFKDPIENDTFSLKWSVGDLDDLSTVVLSYYQSAGFRNFDGIPVFDSGQGNYVYQEGTQGRFDCTFGFDLVQIFAESIVTEDYLLKEDGFYLLQENGDRICI